MSRILLSAGLGVVLSARVWAQSSGQQPPTFRADTHLVQVTVVVQDGRSNAVTDLAAGDFRVFEDGKEQAISLFSADSGPAANVTPNGAPGAAVVSNRALHFRSRLTMPLALGRCIPR